MTTNTALTTQQRAALALDSSKTEAQLRELVASSADIVAVIDNAGREQAHRIGMNLKGARVAIEKTGKAARMDATEFSKSVIAEEARLKAIIEPEESRVLALRDKWDAEREAEKQAKIAAERARVEAIQYRITEFGQIVAKSAGKKSDKIIALQCELAEYIINDELFGEFIPQATAAKNEAALALAAALASAEEAEQAAESARLQREEEDRQRAEQAAENARQKAENDRVAAEQAAARKQIADEAAAQQAAIAKQQAEAEAKIKAAADELTKQAAADQAERDKVMAETKRQMEAQQAAINAERAKLEEEKRAAQQAKDDAAKLEEDHTQALEIDAERDQYLKDIAAVVHAPAVADALISESLDRPDAEPSDEEIVDAYLEAFGGTKEQALERLSRFVAALTA